jgi:hypothetical protein
LLLATAAAPDVAWADRPLGARDAQLLALRCEWFGPWFDAVLACKACGELLSLRVDLRDFAACAVADETPVAVDGLRFRRPTTRDLAALIDHLDVDAAAEALLRRLALDALPPDWDAARQAALEGALDAADPLAHVALDIACEHCGERWTAPLDIGAALWDELAVQAAHVIDDVHVLASAYGWSEREILAMPTTRRQLYKQRVSS